MLTSPGDLGWPAHPSLAPGSPRPRRSRPARPTTRARPPRPERHRRAETAVLSASFNLSGDTCSPGTLHCRALGPAGFPVTLRAQLGCPGPRAAGRPRAPPARPGSRVAAGGGGARRGSGAARRSGSAAGGSATPPPPPPPPLPPPGGHRLGSQKIGRASCRERVSSPV